MRQQAAARAALRSPAAHAAGRTLALAFAALAAALLLAVVVVPRAVGGQALTVLTDSMRPEISAGDVVVVRPVEPEDIAVGDVVTFQAESGPGSALVTHRVVERSVVEGRQVLRTRGDANEEADARLVPVEAVLGRVLYDVPWVGHLRERVPAQGLLLVVAVLGLAGYASVQLLAGLREVREGRARAAAPPPPPTPPPGGTGDVLLAVLPPEVRAEAVRDVLATWHATTTTAVPEPVHQPLPSGEVVVAAAAEQDDLTALALALAALEPAPAPRWSGTGGTGGTGGTLDLRPPEPEVAAGPASAAGTPVAEGPEVPAEPRPAPAPTPHAGRSPRSAVLGAARSALVGGPAGARRPRPVVVGLVAAGLLAVAATGATHAAFTDLADAPLGATADRWNDADEPVILARSSSCLDDEQLATLDRTAQDVDENGLTPDELGTLGLEELPAGCSAAPEATPTEEQVRKPAAEEPVAEGPAAEPGLTEPSSGEPAAPGTPPPPEPVDPSSTTTGTAEGTTSPSDAPVGTSSTAVGPAAAEPDPSQTSAP